MTTVNYLDKTDLHQAVDQFTLDADAQNAVIAQLTSLGLYDPANPDDGKSIWVESDILNNVVQPPLFGAGGSPEVPGFVQVLETQSSFVNIEPDAALKVIIDDADHTSVLNVSGGANPVFIALGSGGTSVNLGDRGNDTVFSSDGNDTITGNAGADSLIAGSGNVSITDLLSGGHSTLVAGSGNDTLTGVQGDTFSLPSGTMVASGADQYNVHEGLGNSTISLGTGADTVNFLASTGFSGVSGNDTIVHAASAGADTINFTGATNNSLLDIKPGAAGITVGTGAHTGDYTINFLDGQSVTLSGHAASSTQTAFVVEFKEGSINLKGGS